MLRRIPLLAVAFAFLPTIGLAGESAEGNWPAWRGPLGTGVAPKADPPTEWSESKNVRWKVAIPGKGNASPIVWGDRIYVLTAIKTDRTAAMGDAEFPTVTMADEAALGNLGLTDSAAAPAYLVQDQPPPPPGEGERPRRPRGEGGGGQGRPGGRGRGEVPTNIHKFEVIALDRKTGKIIWEKTVREAVPHAGTHPDGSQASASPVTDGENIFASFGSAGVYCLDLDGNVKWEKDLGRMQVRMSFGEGASPAVYGDTLVINWDHEGESFIAAFEKKTGKELWRKPRKEGTTWTTPLIVEVGGKAQAIVPATKHIISYDLKTGDTVWECKGLTDNVIPTGVAADGLAILMSGYRGAAIKAIKLSEAKGDISDNKAAVVWATTAEKTPYVPSPLLYGDCVYFFDNTKPMLTCLNAKNGEKNYAQERLEGMQGFYASPVGAANRVYLAGRDGKTAVIKNGPKFEMVAQNALDDGFDASPAIAGNELFLRGREHLYCIAQ